MTLSSPDSFCVLFGLLVWPVIFITIHNGLPRSIVGLNYFPRTETIRSHKSRAGIPSNLRPASKEMMSDSVELCETEVCSYTSNLLEQMYDFPKRIMFPPKWILNLQDLPRRQSPETVPICIVLQYYPHSNTVCIHMCDECKVSIDPGVCHKLWSINSPTDFISSSLKWWSSMHGVDTL